MSSYFRRTVVLYLWVKLVLSSFAHGSSSLDIDVETYTAFFHDDESYVTQQPQWEEVNDAINLLSSGNIKNGSWWSENIHNNDTLPDVGSPYKDGRGHPTEETNLPVKLNIRKCCEENEFFNSETRECMVTTDLLKFIDEIKVIANVTSSFINTFSKKMEDCPDVRTAEMKQNYRIMRNGEIHDQNLSIVYSHAEYCLEIVGVNLESSSLVLVYCSTNRNIIPKCCPLEHFDNLVENDCTPYLGSDGINGDSSLYLYLDENSELGTSNLVCTEPTITVNLNETYFHGNYLCLNKNEQCLHWDKYCIDNLMQNGSTELIQVSHICPELFVKKCCPESEGVSDSGCVKLSTQSPYISETLDNVTYYVSEVINYDSSIKCSPIFIDKHPDHDMSWELDTEGNAVVNKKDGPTITRKFCIDDYVNKNETTTPVLKTCSEEVKEYAPVTSLENYTDDVLGKCCPPSQHLRAGECVNHFNDIELELFNISYLLYKGFPTCQSGKYHSYIVEEHSKTDYVVIADQRRLKVISIIDHCNTKATEITEAKYCLEHSDQNSTESENKSKLHAIVCVAEQKTLHSEKSVIIISLISFSCVALLSSFFILLFMRVRRGMFTVRKVNTLAGRILMSYVISLLIGYVALGVSYIEDFGVKSGKCFALTGVLQFSMIAAFCWNTSICLEGFLLTLDIKTSERLRYIFHSIGAWGISGFITGLTLIIDHNSEKLSCGVITPKIGLQRCFFSDNMALLLYFYFPITVTVILNGILLVASKILRNAQLKKLEGNAKQKKSEKSEQKKATVTNSGLRTHQSRNMVMEYFRLVVWSGGTWLMEIVGTLATMFGGISEGKWYTYLWYIPVSFNCLRGLGIFFLILSTSEYFSKFDRIFKILNCKYAKSANEHELNSHQFKRSEASVDASSENENRKLSTTTIITEITLDSSVHYEPPDPDNPQFYRSISQAVQESANANNLNEAVETIDS